MAVKLQITTEAEVDEFEIAIEEWISNSSLEMGAQMPSAVIAHILRGVYDKLCQDRPNWDEVLNGT